MAILAGDIKLVASVVMDDVDEGGGPPSAHVIVDGASNGVFNDISELDRAVGRVNLRKLFAEVRTVNVDGYFGANVIVADPPDDPAVAISLFSTRDTFDTRDAAKLRIESYLSQGPAYAGYLFGDHITGQGAILLLQRKELAVPVNGDTLVLQKNHGLSNEATQYVRVTSVSTRLRKFADERQDEYERLEVTLTLSDSLRYDFPGFEAQRSDPTDFSNKARVFGSIVADASRYYGVVPLQEAAAIGDFAVRASSIFTQIVPSTRTEVPIADARLNQQASGLIQAGEAFVQTFFLTFTTTQALYIGGSILPGSLTISRGGIDLTDKGGVLLYGDTKVGSVDYSNGIAALSTNVFGGAAGSHAVTYKPATTPTIISESIGVPVSSQGQRLTWVVTLEPIPARRTLQVSYRAQGKWYVLEEDGSGAIRGADSSFGAGSLNFSTGTVSLTLGALPDVGSQIILGWLPAVAARAIGAVPPAGPGLAPAFGKTLQVTDALKPGAINLTWNDGAARSASDDSNGHLTGDATGTVNYGAGTIVFAPGVLPPKDTAVTLTTTNVVQLTPAVSTFTDGGSHWNFTLSGTIKPRSVNLAVAISLPMRAYPGDDHSETRVVRLFDDGMNSLQIASITSNLPVGTIDYGTGACQLNKVTAGLLDEQPKFITTTVLENTQIPALGEPITVPTPVTKISQDGYENRSVSMTILNGSTGLANPGWAWWSAAFGDALQARYAGSDGADEEYHFTFSDAFMPVASGTVAEFQLRESIASTVHRFVLQLGTMEYMHNPLPTNGEGTVYGQVAVVGDQKGVLRTSWPTEGGIRFVSTPTGLAGGTNPLTAGTGSLMLVESVTFRTAIAPLFNGGFSISGVLNAYGSGPTTEEPFTVTPDSNGLINTASVVGRVDYETGIVTLRFGSFTLTPGEHAQDIRYLQIPDKNFSLPKAVQADSLRYNAVGYSYIPLDAEILGLDPVRLPPDGRVPIFRQGTVAVVGNTATVGPATVTNGQTLNCGRVRLSRVRVLGSDGAVIDTGYSADLEAGTVTFTDVTGYAQPVKVEHRVEDMALVSDAQINGQITFTKALTHDYPADTSYVSSAVLAGDMHARVPLVFDQGTWSNVWSDDLIGSPAAGTYDTISHPLTVTNKGALDERWACVFTNTTTFNVIGEHIGQIASGNTGSDCAPLNPATGVPYFTIEAAGWGAGWAPGNVLRFNTIGANFPVWVIRSIQQSDPTVASDAFTLLVRGDVDNP